MVSSAKQLIKKSVGGIFGFTADEELSSVSSALQLIKKSVCGMVPQENRVFGGNAFLKHHLITHVFFSMRLTSQVF
jgi:hypothetical protein